ncbi:M23 family metallopeptidase [uncultured Jatrophihabitans sp.]|uniref:M23 family metallopeptidase n=1 Tax=uncultured Jatrophihabitans sp. TaxID=1610747 RepID=UPI0035CA56F8
MTRLSLALGVVLILLNGFAAGRRVADRSVGRPAAANRIPDRSAAATSGGEPAIVGYRPPVNGPLRVLRRFAAPVTRFGPGHLGVDLAAAASALVVSAGAGRVTFAGAVAGRGVVVVLHPDGVRTEYEPLRPLVRVGAAVRAGDALGRLAGAHRGCRTACVHWGARRGAIYLDPLALLARLGPVRLLPWPLTGRAQRG